MQSQLGKLSIAFLGDVITRIECTESRAFAIIASKDSISTLSRFIGALNIDRSSSEFPSHLWGMPLVECDKIDDRHIVFACKLEGWNNPIDYINAIEHLVDYDPDATYTYGEKLTDENVWGLNVFM